LQKKKTKQTQETQSTQKGKLVYKRFIAKQLNHIKYKLSLDKKNIKNIHMHITMILNLKLSRYIP